MHAWRIFTSSQYTHTQAYHFTLAESVSASRAHAQHKHHRSRIVCSSATPTIKQSEINALWDCARHRRACQTKMSFHIQMFILNLIFVSFESEACSTAHIDKSLRVIRIKLLRCVKSCFAFCIFGCCTVCFMIFDFSKQSTFDKYRMPSTICAATSAARYYDRIWIQHAVCQSDTTK